MTDRRHPHVVNVAELEPRSISKGTRFGAAARSLGRATDAARIGCTHYTVEPGKTAFPHHFHCLNEEAIYVLAGHGTLRLGDTKVAVRAGDWVTLPVGPEHAHQLVNTGTSPLEYLCLSTLGIGGDIVGYPDSKKVGAMAAPSAEKAMKGEHWLRVIVREGSSVDYYDGEDVG